MEFFFGGEDLSALRRKKKRLTAAFLLLAAAAAAGFILLCLSVRTENARAMHYALTGAAVLAGWICIPVWQLGVKGAGTELGHLAMLRDGDKAYHEGRMTLAAETVQIPRSIRVRKVILQPGEHEPISLNLDERLVSRMPPDGSLVRLAVTHSYIAGVEVLEAASGTRRRRPRPGGRKAAGLLPLLGIWTIMAAFLSSYIFYQLTDTDPAHRITIYADCGVRGESRLAALLEKDLPDPIRMVQIHPFSYAMFGSEALKAADLFIVPDSEKEQFAGWFDPEREGVPVHEPDSATSVAAEWFQYLPEESYRLYVGALSVHLEDGLADRAADLLCHLTDEKEKTE